MKIVTWNVNSIRARQARVVAWVEKHRPDVLCLQELKAEDEKFPADEYLALGYHIATFGQKTYNGVALLSTTPLTDLERGFADDVDDPQARFIAGTTGEGVRVMSAYIPNGDTVASEKFQYKLRWYDRLHHYLQPRVRPDQPLALCGDFNVAPAPLDIYDPAGWEGSVLFTLEERAALSRLCELGLTDLVRHLHPTEPMYSWWDYRQLAFPKNLGIRIDHILVTPSLLERAVGAGVDREARKGQQPSDHAPVWAEFH